MDLRSRRSPAGPEHRPHHTTVAPAATTGASSAATPTKQAVRSYGAGPVILQGQDARISFSGERGDIVHLDAGSKLKGSTTKLKVGGRSVAARWDGFWKLPRSDDHTFGFTAREGDPAGRKLQLQKVRVASTELDAKPVAGRRQPRGYLNAVSVRLRRRAASCRRSRRTVRSQSSPRIVGPVNTSSPSRPTSATSSSPTSTARCAGIESSSRRWDHGRRMPPSRAPTGSSTPAPLATR